MSKRGPWITHGDTETLLERRFFSVRSNQVTHPGGGRITYDWIDAPDMVRVAALCDDGQVYVIEQTHFLPGQVLWQLPGGAVDAGETPTEAALRELREEIGYTATALTSYGSVWPLPGLTSVQVHLFAATDLAGGNGQRLDDSEADLVPVRVPLSHAVAATAVGGALRCGPSAHLILAVAADNPA